ncbi:hypothetical protein P9D81_20120 [Bacillus haynesii]|uniref:hypothetical protein n=1 Tax=Bacillus haynesii TaxID=1925021 RepID=UPI002DBF08AF|nr:hypothetical protein [Bacillus haynesii]MEC1657156.1 hypothetical protein [Bacillus haynesii]
MKKLKLGLAANKTSYFDPLTNTYITLEKPVVDVHYENYKVLKNITHAILSSVPALVLYEGKLPEEATIGLLIEQIESKTNQLIYRKHQLKSRQIKNLSQKNL